MVYRKGVFYHIRHEYMPGRKKAFTYTRKKDVDGYLPHMREERKPSWKVGKYIGHGYDAPLSARIGERKR